MARSQTPHACSMCRVLIPLLVVASVQLVQGQQAPQLDVRTLVAAMPLIEGESINGLAVPCSESSSVSITLAWTFNGQPVPADRVTSSFVPVLDLYISQLSLTQRDGLWLEDDSGEYACTANVTSTGAISPPATFTVNVEVRAQISNLTQSQEVLAGDDITLLCKTRGSFPLNYTWTTSTGDVIRQVSSDSLTDSFTITGASRNDTLNYTCAVSNAFGNGSRTTRLDVIEVPDLGMELALMARIIPEEFQRITLSWTNEFFDGNTPITSYSVICQGVGTNRRFFSVPVNLPADTRSTTISGLHPGRTYGCFLVVANKVGNSSSMPVTATVLEEPPNAAPTAISARATSSVSIDVAWQVIPAINQLGVLTGYRVSYEADCASCPCTEYTCSTTGVMDVGPTAAAATLDGLRRYTDYRISVRALNRAGPGTNSDPTVVRTGEHLPEAATGFEAEQEEDISGMKLSWTAPVEANGVITHYELTYHSQGTDGPDRRETLVADQNVDLSRITVNVVGLLPSTMYLFSLVAVNRIGMGRPVNTTAATAAFPSFSNVMTDMLRTHKAETRSVTLMCVVNGDPTPTVYWNRLGNATRVLAGDGGSLTIENLMESDDGIYVCSATNTWGSQSTNVTLMVLPASPGYIISGFKDTYLFLCIAGAVLLILILITGCVLCCRRKRRNNDYQPKRRGNQPTTAFSLTNPHFEDVASQPSSPPQYGPKPTAHHNGVGEPTFVTVTGPEPSDTFDGHFSHAATFQQHTDHNYRQTVTPVATLNNQHNHEPSMLSQASFFPAGGPSNADPPKYGTASQNETGHAQGGGQLEMKSLNQSTSALTTNEQLPTYTARHGDHILTAM